MHQRHGFLPRRVALDFEDVLAGGTLYIGHAAAGSRLKGSWLAEDWRVGEGMDRHFAAVEYAKAFKERADCRKQLLALEVFSWLVLAGWTVFVMVMFWFTSSMHCSRRSGGKATGNQPQTERLGTQQWARAGSGLSRVRSKTR